MADILASNAASGESKPLDASRVGLTQDDALAMIGAAVDWTSTHGLLMGTDTAAFTHVPLSLLPVPYCRAEFEKGCALAVPFGLLYDRISRDLEWLYASLESVLEDDEFTAKLVEICKAAYSQDEKPTQTKHLGIFRSDYMLHEPDENTAPKLLQVEFNTIASSFAYLSTHTCELHKFLLKRYAISNPDTCAYLSIKPTDAAIDSLIPHNMSSKELPAALACAQRSYGSCADSRADAIVVFVVQPGEMNVVDQRGLEHELWYAHGVRAVRKTLNSTCPGLIRSVNGFLSSQGELHKEARLEGAERRLVLGGRDGGEVAVAYFRAGYRPEDYPTEDEWSARLLVERSFAIKCPSVPMHLSGAKKIQQELAAPGRVERFLPEHPQYSAQIREVFAGLYGLEQETIAGDELTKSAIASALTNPGQYVIKPQREGGGNNLYNDDVKKALENMTPVELAGHIMMQVVLLRYLQRQLTAPLIERIFPRKRPAVLVRHGKGVGCEAISELGMYSVFLGDDKQVILNKHAGHLLRSKMEGVDEGGIAAGFAVLSSPGLYGAGRETADDSCTNSGIFGCT